jgi:hypothetical protein
MIPSRVASVLLSFSLILVFAGGTISVNIGNYPMRLRIPDGRTDANLETEAESAGAGRCEAPSEQAAAMEAGCRSSGVHGFPVVTLPLSRR